MTITCFGPVFIGLKWDFLYYRVKCLKIKVPKVKGIKITITCFGFT